MKLKACQWLLDADQRKLFFIGCRTVSNGANVLPRVIAIPLFNDYNCLFSDQYYPPIRKLLLEQECWPEDASANLWPK